MSSARMLLSETKVIAKLMREDGKNVSLSLEDVPNETGGYGVYDGTHCRGGGVTHHMRDAIRSMLGSRELKRPIFEWQPDDDGSVALWLEGKARCLRCADKPIFDIDDLEQHGQDVHGDDECECR